MKNRISTIKKNQKGQAALLIVLITMTLLLFVALVLTNIVAKRTKMTRDTLQSVQAYYLADAGTERLLYLTLATGAIDPGPPLVGTELLNEDIDFDGSTDFNVVKTNASPLRLKITGYYKKTERAVDLSW